VWTSERERDAMTIERDADDVASCFALEQLLYESGHDQPFAGEVTGLISAGAFVTFGPEESDEETPDAPPFRGMLPVRSLARMADAASRPSGDGRRREVGAERDARREWWELNEQGTIMRGEQTGAKLGLGDPIEVRVARVETIRGRVDLTPAG
jgi:ribonuclease R